MYVCVFPANPPEPVVPDGTMLLELNENGGLKGIRDINNHRDVTKWWCRNHDGWRFTCSGPKLCCTLYTDLSSVDPAVLAKSMVNEWTKECGPDSARRAWENQVCIIFVCACLVLACCAFPCAAYAKYTERRFFFAVILAVVCACLHSASAQK